MNIKIPAGLLDATRLVRGGKLHEATAAIQRALGIGAAPGASPVEDGPDPIEGTYSVLNADGMAARAAAPRPSPAAAHAHGAQGGRFLTCSYSNAAGTRAYKLYVPGVYEGQPLPLVVMLHGCKQNPDDFAAGTRMNALAEAHGFLVAYPAQSAHANVSGCWNWFQTNDQQREQGEPSLIAGITREVIDSYGIDVDRVYVAGLSAGGAMAAIMGATYPDLFDATGVHSGLAYAAASDLPSAFAAMRGGAATRPQGRSRHAATGVVRTIVFHGDSDMTVHPSNGHHVIAQGAGPGVTSGARGDHAAAGTRARVQTGEARGRAYTRTSHLDSAGKATMEHWVVHGAGHAWSGGSDEGSFTDVKGPDASREMMRFFLQTDSTSFVSE